MKLTLPTTQLLCIIFTLSAQISFSQISIQSSKGYSVNIYVAPTNLIVHGQGCTWGYNYDVELEFVVTFSGNNLPSALYTLQGTIVDANASFFFSLPKNGGTGKIKTNSRAWRAISDCSVATVSTMNFHTINITISGDGINHQVVSFAYSAVLPVKMTDFTVREEGSNVRLNWQTATETDNDYFTIERSANQNDWIALKKVRGAGNSTDLKNYEATDEAPNAGISYYRIKQTDFNGNATYSETRSVKMSPNRQALSVFPVPNNGNTINIRGIQDHRNYELSVINTGGAKIYNMGLSSTTVQLPDLTKGVYFIQIKNRQSGDTNTLRYVKI